MSIKITWASLQNPKEYLKLLALLADALVGLTFSPFALKVSGTEFLILKNIRPTICRHMQTSRGSRHMALSWA